MAIMNATDPETLWRLAQPVKYSGYENIYISYTNTEYATVWHYVSSTKGCIQMLNMFNYLYNMVYMLGLSIAQVMMMNPYAFALIAVYLFLMYVVGRYFIFLNVITLCKQWNMVTYNFGASVFMGVIVLPNTISILCSWNMHGENGSIRFTELLGKAFICFFAANITRSMKHHWSLMPAVFYLNIALIGSGGIYLFQAMFFNDDNTPLSYSFIIHGTFMFILYLFYRTMMMLQPSTISRSVDLEVSGYRTESLAPGDYKKENLIDNEGNPWDVFIDLSNIDNNRLKSNSLFIGLMAPVRFVVSFLVPVVTTTRPLNGWCKFQAITSLVLFPLRFYFLSNSFVYYGLIMLCVLAAILTKVGTNKKQIPPNHFFYGLFGILAASTIYQTLDAEVEALIWQIFGLSHLDVDVILMLAKLISQAVYVSAFFHATIQEGYLHMAYTMIIGVTIYFTYACLPLMFSNGFACDEESALPADVEATYYFMLVTFGVLFLGVGLSNYELHISLGFNILYVCLSYIMIRFNYVDPIGSQHAAEIFRDANHTGLIGLD